MPARKLFDLIYFSASRQSKQGSRGGGGYTYKVEGQYQGTHRNVLVIGDRKAGTTAREIRQHPSVLKTLRGNIGLPVKWILVVRNPYNTISTSVRKARRGRRRASEVRLRDQIEQYFWRAEAARQVLDVFGTEALNIVYLEELIRNPSGELSALCSFLDLPQDPEYINRCAAIVQRTPNITTEGIPWSPSSISLVAERMEDFPWLAGGRYRFE
jgi:hypothetical protein